MMKINVAERSVDPITGCTCCFGSEPGELCRDVDSLLFQYAALPTLPSWVDTDTCHDCRTLKGSSNCGELQCVNPECTSYLEVDREDDWD